MELQAFSSSITVASEAALALFAGVAASDVAGDLRKWLADSFERAPALVLGMAALLTLPPLAVLGWLIGFGRRKSAPRSGGERTVAVRRDRTPSGRPEKLEPLRTSSPVWPTESWLETVTEAPARHRIGHAVVRIGREADNEICLSHKTVHRYHAAVHRTSDAEVLITDLSSADGNGVLVNGRRVREARLQNGDVIRLGEAELIFTAKPK